MTLALAQGLRSNTLCRMVFQYGRAGPASTSLLTRIQNVYGIYLQVYVALLVLAIKEVEEENQAARAEVQSSGDVGDILVEKYQTHYMGWIIDDFPGTTEQVSK